MGMNMQHGHGHEEYSWTCLMDINIQNGHGHAYMEMQHGHDMQRGHELVHAACLGVWEKEISPKLRFTTKWKNSISGKTLLIFFGWIRW
jgi:hypothetical protein